MLVFVQDYAGDAGVPLPPARPDLQLTPVPLFPGEPARRRLGALSYLGGVAIRERGGGIGGYSALSVEGDRFTLVSDLGNVLRFRLALPGEARDARGWALPETGNSGWSRPARDSESMAHDPATGTRWLGFETSNRIVRYDDALATSTGMARPPLMREWPRNGGAESLVRLADGRFVAFAEIARGKLRGTRQAVMFAGDPVAAPARAFAFTYRPPRGYRPVDAAQLPDGRLLVLTRAFSLPFYFRNTIELVDTAAIRPGATIKGRTIARLERPALHDNFEGMAIVRERGATILWLVSDDNQMVLQRTLLLKFRVDASRLPPAR
ncbi:esterase-like activity of phytase family protein [Sphingomonas baiyangensis]|uniref:Esterase-like activity of phytase family protein n=2 Tax=Sphingomonas baiyangensis TaxID=2572576 RepID=A0A4U1L8Q2_9SPHN|nr:esterase-like activity of phytase family protein [Sphingomonas baiyangensis]